MNGTGPSPDSIISFLLAIARRGAFAPLTAMVLILAIAGCGSSETTSESIPESGYRYRAAAPLTERTVETLAKDLSVRCPEGWKETVDQKNAPNIILWLVRDDYSASISFTPMQMNPALYKTLKKDGLMAVAKASLSMKKDNARDTVSVVQPPERFHIGTREFVAYEYSADRGASVVRVAVFDTGTRYIECALLPATTPIAAAENTRLFETQQTVLASMRTP
jgi:hypothetical protein